ncbi:MAG: hypothetical protein AMJ95_04030 [Omnitrophica WOR_2 bacterium SM23_72]|nr:MAG: hypothetical protein AMJ95_04030 [Omnitrophica WOR_2 bacterium SM23_72]
MPNTDEKLRYLTIRFYFNGLLRSFTKILYSSMKIVSIDAKNMKNIWGKGETQLLPFYIGKKNGCRG